MYDQYADDVECVAACQEQVAVRWARIGETKLYTPVCLSVCLCRGVWRTSVIGRSSATYSEQSRPSNTCLRVASFLPTFDVYVVSLVSFKVASLYQQLRSSCKNKESRYSTRSIVLRKGTTVTDGIWTCDPKSDTLDRSAIGTPDIIAQRSYLIQRGGDSVQSKVDSTDKKCKAHRQDLNQRYLKLRSKVHHLRLAFH
ncbi:hypothetical protein J6590_029955 [Homalodisca vitripennis]|nr:hypothetical protein J6590_029955 [Homalodisca vitripennis]